MALRRLLISGCVGGTGCIVIPMVDHETHLQMAERHVVEQRQRISRQHERIAHLMALGLPVDLAEDVLDRMNDLLETMVADVNRLSRSRISN